MDAIRKEAKKEVRSLQKEAWKEFREDIDGELATVANLIKGLEGADSQRAASLEKELDPGRADVMIAARRSIQDTNGTTSPEREALKNWLASVSKKNYFRYNSDLYSEHDDNALNVQNIPAQYEAEPEMVDGRIILQRNFEHIFNERPEVLTFGEDVGGIGGVNQVMEGCKRNSAKSESATLVFANAPSSVLELVWP